MVRAHYFIIHIDQEGREKVYHLLTPLLVGRSNPCQIPLPMEGVSRCHCRFSLVESKVVLEDLDSTNGTFLNGTRIREAIVRPGDRIVVGSATLRLVSNRDFLPMEAGQTRLLGQTTIDLYLDAAGEELPDPVRLSRQGLSENYLKALFQLTETVNSVKEMDELLSKSLGLLMDLFGMDLGCIVEGKPDQAPGKPVLLVNNTGLSGYQPSTSVLN